MDYAYLPIRCRYCNDLCHQVKDCPERTSYRRNLNPSHPTPPITRSTSDSPPNDNHMTSVDMEDVAPSTRNMNPTSSRPPPQLHDGQDEEMHAPEQDSTPPQHQPGNILSPLLTLHRILQLLQAGIGFSLTTTQISTLPQRPKEPPPQTLLPTQIP